MRTSAQLALSLGLVLTGACSGASEPVDIGAAVGSSSAPVVGGSPTTGYPAVPLLYSEFSEADGAQLCSGTLISPRVVMTAAHCVDFPDGEPTSYLAYFGSNVTVESDPQRIGAVPIVGYLAHPQWSIDDLEGGHDIGLVVLSRAAPVEPMAINRTPIDERVGQGVRLVGWGRTSGQGEDYGVKREVSTTLQGADAQLMQYGSASANTCQGDSGGPNFMTIDGVEVVAGITSFGNVGCDQYGFGTRVDVHAVSFVQPFIAQNDPDAEPIDDPGDGSGDGAGDGSGDGADISDDGGAVTGGCSAGVPSGGVGFTLVLFLTLAVPRARARFRCRSAAARAGQQP